jgi:hypothetical protein
VSGPISVRLAQFAQRFYAARCRCVIDGDSINSDEAQPRMIGGYIRKLRPPRGMSGYCGLGASAGNQAAFVNNRPTGTSGGGLHGFGSTSPGTDTSTAGESKVHTTVFDDSGLWPGDKTHFDLFYDAKFLKTTAGAPPGAYTIGRSDFPGGDFLTGADSTCRLSLYSGSAGIRQATFTASRDGGSSNATFMDNVTLAAGYNTIDIPLTADPRDVQIQILAGAGENETNKNIYLLMLRWFASSGTGLELSFAAKGSSNVTQRADTANRVTQAARNNHVSVERRELQFHRRDVVRQPAHPDRLVAHRDHRRRPHAEVPARDVVPDHEQQRGQGRGDGRLPPSRRQHVLGCVLLLPRR